MIRFHRSVLFAVAFCVVLSCLSPVNQAAEQGGFIKGTVLDPSGAAIPKATVTIQNALSGYQQTATTDADGRFDFNSVPPNPYRLEVNYPGFGTYHQDVSVRTSVPINLKISLAIAGVSITVQVQSSAEVLEDVPYAHSDLTKQTFEKLPVVSPSSGLNDVVTLSTPGVVADSNGFFHPLGDHAQTTFSIDGQPISDQLSKLFSTQVPLNAISSMELITGAPGAQFGDKTSLIVNAETESGLGKKPFGSVGFQYGAFGSPSEEASLGWGNAKYGNFVVLNTSRSGRFLDTPEFRPIHDIGNNETFFDHFDYTPDEKDTFHLNLMGARNWFQIPNTFDQPNQDQRQKTITFNIAPSYQHLFSPTMQLDINIFFRQDQIHYYPSANPFLDKPATLAQSRRLTNYGFKAEISYVKHMHNLKVGTQIMQTRLKEDFSMGITDPLFNAVCVDQSGNPQALPGITSPSLCAGSGFLPNPDLQSGLAPYDLTRGGSLFNFNGSANINEFAFYAQDEINYRGFTFSPGLRVDRYAGLSKATGVEPRMGVSYLVKQTGTVLRLSYSRTFETPYNENLVLSSATGAGGLATNVFGAFGSQPLAPGRRNQFNSGFQQSLGRFFILDGDYFWKFTDNAFDFDTLFNTPIHFPISWQKSKIDGFSLRLVTTNVHGIQAEFIAGHARARFFGPEVGGLIFNSPLDSSVFRIDHDQAFQQTTNVRYQRPHNGPWVSFTWRYDSGEVAGAVTSLSDALSLTAAQKAAIGFFCGNQTATLTNPITSCTGSNYGATRLIIPASGMFNPDLNPPRIAPRHLFDIGVGTDNLFHSGSDRPRTALRFSVLNMTNSVSLYNFLSTFSGTHFMAPRTYQAEIKLIF